MFDSWLIPLGRVGIRLSICAPEQVDALANYVHNFSLGVTRDCDEIWHLVIVTPTPLSEDSVLPDNLPLESQKIAKQLCRFWSVVGQRGFSSGDLATTSIPWVKPWDEAISDLKLLRYEQGDHTVAFVLLTKTQTYHVPKTITQPLYFLATWWHVLHQSVLLHASAVADERGGYLFLGPGGAGKTTIATLSADVGRHVLSDDLVFVTGNSHPYQLIAAPGLAETLTTAPQLVPALRAVFAVTQADEDRLIPLTHFSKVQLLWQSFIWNHWARYLPKNAVDIALQNVIDIAHRTPGYELRFRKSTDFWKLIDAELS